MCILAGFCPSDGGPVRLGLSLWSRALVRYDQPTNSCLSIGNAAVYIFLLKSCKKKKKLLVLHVNLNNVNVKGVL